MTNEDKQEYIRLFLQASMQRDMCRRSPIDGGSHLYVNISDGLHMKQTLLSREEHAMLQKLQAEISQEVQTSKSK